MTRIPTLLVLLLGMIAAPVHHDGRFHLAFPASAQDDDDDGDGGNDDDDDRGSARSDRDSRPPAVRPAPQPQQPVRRAPRPAPPPPPPPPPPPEFADNEFIALGLSAENLVAIGTLGYVILETLPLATIGQLAVRLAPPSGRTLAQAQAEIDGLVPGAASDLNHFYRVEEGPAQDPEPVPCTGPHCPTRLQINWPAPASPRDLPAGCDPGGEIGMIDTGINAAHKTFAEGRIEVVALARQDLPASGAQHGTAVASILIGSADSRSPGLLPQARLIAVDAFHRTGQDERSDAFTLLRGLDYLADRGVRVINLSLAGPANAPLERLLATLEAANIVVVASAGNGGPRSEPEYPAAYPSVIAVTAVGRDGQVYRRAAQGGHVDLAAPGVEVWTAASISGARPKTGTSFAAPFVTAAAHVLMAADRTPAEVREILMQTATDLGAPGPDPVYGAGLLNAADLCHTGQPEHRQADH